MIELLLECVLFFPEYLLKYPGNLILRLFGRDIDLDEDSFAAYASGIVLWLVIIFLIGLVVFWR